MSDDLEAAMAPLPDAEEAAPKKRGRKAKPVEVISEPIPAAAHDMELFSEEELKEIQEEAAAEERARQRKDAKERIKKSALAQVRQRVDPNEEICTITLDFAGHSDRAIIDGVIYLHGHTYRVPKRVYDVLREIQARGWEHEDEVGGANRDQYRKQRNTVVSPMGTANAPAGNITYSNMMRV